MSIDEIKNLNDAELKNEINRIENIVYFPHESKNLNVGILNTLNAKLVVLCEIWNQRVTADYLYN